MRNEIPSMKRLHTLRVFGSTKSRRTNYTTESYSFTPALTINNLRHSSEKLTPNFEFKNRKNRYQVMCHCLR